MGGGDGFESKPREWLSSAAQCLYWSDLKHFGDGLERKPQQVVEILQQYVGLN